MKTESFTIALREYGYIVLMGVTMIGGMILTGLPGRMIAQAMDGNYEKLDFTTPQVILGIVMMSLFFPVAILDARANRRKPA